MWQRAKRHGQRGVIATTTMPRQVAGVPVAVVRMGLLTRLAMQGRRQSVRSVERIARAGAAIVRLVIPGESKHSTIPLRRCSVLWFLSSCKMI